MAIETAPAATLYGRAAFNYAFYVFPGTAAGQFAWRMSLNSKAGSLHAFFDLLSRIKQSLEDTRDDPEWWVGLED